MKTNNHNIVIHKGETFTIDKILKNRDGTPFIISDGNDDFSAYFLISVVSSTYTQDKRYSKDYWLSLESFPRFTRTTPMKLQEFTGVENISFDSLTIVERDGVYGFNAGINGEYCFIPNSYAVYYDENYPNVFKYVTSDGEWSNYECRIIKTFSHEDTSEWTSKNYKYSIRLIYGKNLKEYLKFIANANNISYVHPLDATIELDIETLYSKLLELNLVTSDIDVSIPIVSIDVVVPILEPSDINIISYK